MLWEPMSMEEYAAYHGACSGRVVKVGETWWTEPRPFFFRPLFPFAEIVPQSNSYPLQSVVGGVLHPVPEGAASNSRISLFVYDRLGDYSPDRMAAKQRWIIRKGSEHFEARRITSAEEFIDQGSAIYGSFYDRTRYFYKRERTGREAFSAWARCVLRHPKAVVLGAYHDGRLCAVDISYQVQDVIIDDVFFSDTESQSHRVTDFMLHTLREHAKTADARLLFRGFPSGKQSLDASKLTRGCAVARLPAFFRINPLTRCVVSTFMRDSYRKLLAITSFPETGTPAPAQAGDAA